MDFPSKTVQNAVDALSRLPGIGRKTALRLALSILKGTEAEAELLGNSIIDLRKNTRRCSNCGNLADPPPDGSAYTLCGVCTNPRRDASLICVVAEASDLLALEKTQQYNGLYHVLGGIIDPMAGIGPGQLHVERLVQRVAQPEEGRPAVAEVILALPGSMEGETTAFYLAKRLKETAVRISHIARGIPLGSELEYTDEATLARSMQARIPYVS